MAQRTSWSAWTILIALSALWFAAILVTLAVFGLFIGLGVLAVLLIVPFSLAAMAQGRMPWELERPQRDEWYLIGSLVVIAGFTVLAWALLPPWAWVAVPIVGLWGILSLYGLSKVKPGTAAARRQAMMHAPRPIIYSGATNMLIKEWSAMLAEVDIFKDLTPEQRDQVAALGNVRIVREGESLGSEGMEGMSVYVILDGRAQLSANSSVGRITARVAGPGESLPLASILGEGKLITSIEARTDMRVWQVDSAKLRAFFSNHPEIAAKVYYVAATVLADRYRHTLWRLTEQSASIAKSEAFWANV